MSILITPEEYLNLKKWVKEEMKTDVYTELNAKQIQAFKMLITEDYGWPYFTLNFATDMKRIIKIEL